ncbi:hypothetical protein D9M68_583110 [compost metagenome]
MLHRAVVLAQVGRVAREVGRQLDLLHQFVRGQALVHPAHGLVMDIGDGVAGHAQHLLHLVLAGHRLAVQRHHVVGLEGTQLVEAVHPDHRVAELGAAQGVDVRQGRALGHLGADQHLVLRQEQHDLVRRLAGHVEELHRQTGDGGVEPVLEGDGGRDEGGRAHMGQWAETGVHVLLVALRQGSAEAVARAHAEDGTDQGALGHHVLQQGFLGVDLHFALLHLLFADEALHAVDVVGVEVGIDDGLDRLVADLAELRQHLARLVRRLAGVDDDQPFGRIDHHAVGEVPTDRRIDVVGDLVDLLAEVPGVLGQFGIDAGFDRFFRQGGVRAQGQCGGQQQAAETGSDAHGSLGIVVMGADRLAGAC